MKVALMLSMAVVLGLVMGFGMFALLYWISDTIQTRAQPFYMLLTRTGVQAGEQVLARLEAQATRRHFWGAVGGGPINPSSGRVRVTAMQPHGMTDSLHRREIAVELGLAAFGWGSVMVGFASLGDFGGLSIADETAVAMMLAGAVLAVVATTALLGQHWLLGAHLRARDRDELTTADVVLAMGLRDLLAATVAMSSTATLIALFAPDPAWWLVAMFGGASLISISALIGVRRRRSLLPVARRLSLGPSS